MAEYKTILISLLLFAFISQCANREIRGKSKNSGDSSFAHTQGSSTNTLQEMQPSNKTMVLQGIFDSSGNKLTKVENPAIYNRPLSRPTPDQREGRYVAVINYDGGDSVKVFFDGLVSGDRKGVTQHGFWEIQVPIKDDKIKSVKILESRTRRLHADFKNKDIIRH